MVTSGRIKKPKLFIFQSLNLIKMYTGTRSYSRDIAVEIMSEEKPKDYCEKIILHYGSVAQ